MPLVLSDGKSACRSTHRERYPKTAHECWEYGPALAVFHPLLSCGPDGESDSPSPLGRCARRYHAAQPPIDFSVSTNSDICQAVNSTYICMVPYLYSALLPPHPFNHSSYPRCLQNLLLVERSPPPIPQSALQMTTIDVCTTFYHTLCGYRY